MTHNVDGTTTVDDTALDGSRHVGTYDASGHLVRETVYGPGGAVGQATYNADGSVTHSGSFVAIDFHGNQITTTYASDGSYTESDPFGGARHFDATGHLTSSAFVNRPPIPTGTASSNAVITYNPDGSIATRTYTWDDTAGHHSLSWPPGDQMVDTITHSDGTGAATSYRWNSGAPYSTGTTPV